MVMVSRFHTPGPPGTTIKWGLSAASSCHEVASTGTPTSVCSRPDRARSGRHNRRRGFFSHRPFWWPYWQDLPAAAGPISDSLSFLSRGLRTENTEKSHPMNMHMEPDAVAASMNPGNRLALAIVDPSSAGYFIAKRALERGFMCIAISLSHAAPADIDF